MEFSNARSSRQRTEETLPWAKAPQHSISNCATKQPSVWMNSKKKKKIWQWSDCSSLTSNPAISNPSTGHAGNRQTLLKSSSSGWQYQRWREEDLLFFRRPRSHTTIVASVTFSHETKRGMSRANTHLVPFVNGEPEASYMDQLSCFLSNYLPTTLEKQPRSAKNQQSPKSQNNE